MTRLTAHELHKALVAEGVRVVVVRRGGKVWPNNTSSGSFNPHGVLNHHTAMNSKRIKPGVQVSLLWDGRTGLRGPLSHIGLGRKGTAYLVGWDNANHAGLGDDDVLRAIIREHDLPSPNENNTDGNPHFWGIEVFNDGVGEHYPLDQIEALVKINAAICRASGWTEKSCLHHRQWSNRKIDMSYHKALRPMIRAALAKPPGVWNIRGEEEPEPTPVADPKTSPAKKVGMANTKKAIANSQKNEHRLGVLRKIRRLWKSLR